MSVVPPQRVGKYFFPARGGRAERGRVKVSCELEEDGVAQFFQCDSHLILNGFY